MDINSIVTVIIGFCCLHTVRAYLTCIECTHIQYDPSVTFEGSQVIYDILRGKYNPACAMQNPLDRRTYEQSALVNNQFNNYAVSDTICSSMGIGNKCSYVHGDVYVVLKDYGVTLKLNMHIRNCMSLPLLENDMCYTRTNYNDIKTLFEDRLVFVSRNIEVTKVEPALQCVCERDRCLADVSSASKIQGFSFVFVSMLVSYLFSKVY